jgi:heat shock protein HslJ
MKKYCLILMALLGVSISCKAQKDLDFSKTKWILKTVDGQEVETQDTLTKPAYIIFDEDELLATGYSGCNGYSASFYLSGDILKFENSVATKRRCLNRNVESLLFSVLSRTDACLVIGNKLILTQMSVEIATFEGIAEN